MHDVLKNFLKKSQRKKVTLKGKKCFFQGKEVKKLQEYNIYCPLSDEE